MNAVGTGSVRFMVQDSSHVAESRRHVTALAHEIGFDETDAGRAAVVASEMATNLVKHAGGGCLLVRPLSDGIDLLAVDQGPGMADPTECSVPWQLIQPMRMPIPIWDRHNFIWA